MGYRGERMEKELKDELRSYLEMLVAAGKGELCIDLGNLQTGAEHLLERLEVAK